MEFPLRRTGLRTVALVAGLLALVSISVADAATVTVTTAQATATTVTKSAPSPFNFLLTPASGARTAGVAFSVFLQARTGTTSDSSYAGSKTLSISAPTAPDGASSGTLAPTTVTFNSGFAVVSVTLFDAITTNTFVIQETSAPRSGSATVSVNAAMSFTNVVGNGGSPTSCPMTNQGSSNPRETLKINIKDAWLNTRYVAGVVSLTVSLSDTTRSSISPGNTTVTSPATVSTTETITNGSLVTTTVQVSASGYTSISCVISR